MFFRFLNVSINNYNYPFYIVVLFYFYRQRCWLVLKRFKGALAVIFEFNSTSLWFLIASQFNVSFRFPYHRFNGYQCTVLPWQHLNCQKWMNVYIIHFEEDLSCIKWLLSNINIIRNLKSRIFFGPVYWRNENTSLNVYDLAKLKGRTYNKRFLSNSAQVRYGFALFPLWDYDFEKVIFCQKCNLIQVTVK